MFIFINIEFGTNPQNMMCMGQIGGHFTLLGLGPVMRATAIAKFSNGNPLKIMLKFYLALKFYPIKYVNEAFSILMHSLLDFNWPRNGIGIPLRPCCLHNVSVPICNQFNCDVKFCKCLPSYNDPFLHPSLVLALIIENINVVQLIWGNNLKPCFIETNTILYTLFFLCR